MDVPQRGRHVHERVTIVSFHISDMTSLAEITDRDFDVVAALDNALPLGKCSSRP